MKRHIQILLPALFIAMLFLTNSCRYDNVETLYPVCDTTEVKYSTTIIPILQSNCYRCHGTASSSGSGNIVLQDYNVLKTYAADGRLYGNVAHLPGYIAMPYDGGKLSDCDILKIKNWVSKGYPNN